MIDQWLPWVVLLCAVLVYSLTTLALRVMEPQGLYARLGFQQSDGGDDDNKISSPAEYRATRIVITTVRTASVIAIVMSSLEGARMFSWGLDGLWLMTVVAACVLVGVIALRTLLNRLADVCHDDVDIWLSPLIWLSAFIGRLVGLNRVAEYIYETDSASESNDDAGENVMNVLQNIAANDLRGSDLMLPLSEVVAVGSDSSLEEMADMMIRLDISSVLIYGDMIDEVQGTVNKADVLQVLRESGDNGLMAGDVPMLSDVFYVPVTQQVANLFDDFKGKVEQTAVMLDEQGLVAGILTYDLMMRRLLMNGDANELSNSSGDVGSDAAA